MMDYPEISHKPLYINFSITAAINKTRNYTGQIAGIIGFLLFLLPSANILGAEDKEPPLQDWQIKGYSAALNDPDTDVFMAAVSHPGAGQLLSVIGKSKNIQIERLIDMLRDTDERIRWAAVGAYRLMGDSAKGHLPSVVKLLNNPDSNIRISALEVMQAYGKNSANYTNQIAALLDDPNKWVRTGAISALSATGGAAKEQLPRLTQLLDDPDRDIRSAAIVALGSIESVNKEYAPRFVNLLQDREVFWAAANSLEDMGEAAYDQAYPIAELLDHPNRDVRAAAARILGSFGAAAKEQIPRLISLLDDPDMIVRSTAIRSLGNLGEAASDFAPQLVTLLQDPDVGYDAANALGNMADAAREQIPHIAALLNDSDRDVRSAAVYALGAMGEAAAEYAPRLVELIHDRDIRYAAVDAIRLMGPAAKDLVPKISALLQDSEKETRLAAIQMLAVLGEAAEDQIPNLEQLFYDNDKDIRVSAIYAISDMGQAAKGQSHLVEKLLTDSDEYTRLSAVNLIRGGLCPVNMATILSILDFAYLYPTSVGEYRFLAHYCSGGDTEIQRLLAWLAKPAVDPIQTVSEDHDEAVITLELFLKAWDLSHSFPDLRQDLASQIARVTSKGPWNTDDISLLERHEQNLRALDVTHSQAIVVHQAIASLQPMQWLSGISRFWLMHALFWIVLIFVYPRSAQIQAIFFWNPWMRRFIGLGYIGFALTWIPFFRAKLFIPFKSPLTADAALEDFDSASYFKGSNVRIGNVVGPTGPILEKIPEIKGQIVLEGESGLGKTMFLRYLVHRSKRVIVYLPAKKCANGVMEAIQAKLLGPAKDPKFLRNLIYVGAIDICIDGLNEVSPDTRAQVTLFAEHYFKGNIIMGTQPLEWTMPATASRFIMLALNKEQVEDFLLSRKDILPDNTPVSGEQYENACRTYLVQAFDAGQSRESLEATQQVLSNPMDLTVIAAMLAQGEQPDLFHLQEQQYRLMADDYKRVNIDHTFPLDAFAEQVYQMRLQDQVALSGEEFHNELECMERHKMVLLRQSLDAHKVVAKEWHFRHDKVMDYFIVQSFLGPENDRPGKHLGDARFRGVYLLLAQLLPLQDAEILRERLIQYAADTRDHTVSDSFIKLLRSRQAA